VRLLPSPDEQVLEFLQSSYEAAARLGNWQRSELEREELVKPLKKAADAGQWPA
jgi:Family of unknown function (DUF5996)